jgi:ferredoxin-type protein NapH
MSDKIYQEKFSISGLMNQLQIFRHFVQLTVFLFLNAKLIGLVSTDVIVPYLHSTQGPWSVVQGAYDAMEYTLSKGLPPILVLGIIYLTAITVGRLYCGWACPLGMVQDFLLYLPIPKQRFSQKTLDNFRDIKYAFLAFSLFTTILVGMKRSEYNPYPIGFFSDAPFSVLSPHATLFTYLPWAVIWKPTVFISAGLIPWLKIILMLACIGPAAVIPRFFCRYICPLGAMLEPLSRFKTLRIYRAQNYAKEDLNKLLSDVCPMGVQVTSDDTNFIDSPSCIHCGRCVVEAPKKLFPQSH